MACGFASIFQRTSASRLVAEGSRVVVVLRDEPDSSSAGGLNRFCPSPKNIDPLTLTSYVSMGLNIETTHIWENW